MALDAASAFFDPNDPSHVDLLSQRLREWNEGLVKTVERAEDDVLKFLDQDVDGRLQIRGVEDLETYHLVAPEETSVRTDLMWPQTVDTLRLGIARQAEWLFVHRDKVRPAIYATGLHEILSPILPTERGKLRWFGR
jgi:hypothetical protein